MTEAASSGRACALPQHELAERPWVIWVVLCFALDADEFVAQARHALERFPWLRARDGVAAGVQPDAFGHRGQSGAASAVQATDEGGSPGAPDQGARTTDVRPVCAAA